MTKQLKTLVILSAMTAVGSLSISGNANAMVATSQNFSVESVASTAAHKDGWEVVNGKYYYYYKGEKVTNSWFKKDNYWYYATKTGAMKTGWLYSTGYNNNGQSYWYYFDNTGKMQTGLKKISGYWYFFNDGKSECKGFSHPIGAMLDGSNDCWAIIDNKIHMFDENGQAYSGWISYDDKHTYYFYDSGVPAYGVKTINNKKYLFVNESTQTVRLFTEKNTKPGYLAKNQWVIINDKDKYYANNNGIAVTGWKTINNKNYYFDTNCKLVTGWKQINNNWYYFNNAKSDKFYSSTKIDNDNYGRKLESGVAKINNKYYGFNANGTMATGWKKFGSTYYYFDKSTGVVKTGWQTLPINNTSTTTAKFYFDASGKMYTGLKTISGKKYFFGNTYGKLTYGWQKISSKWYYFDKNNSGAAVVNTSKKIGNKTYKFNKDGVCTNK